MTTVDVPSLIHILNDESLDAKGKSDAIITLIGQRLPEDVVPLLWDTVIWNATHPRKGSSSNTRVLDAVYHYYTDEE